MYLVFAPINMLAFAPSACPDNSDQTAALRKSNSQDTLPCLSETVIPFLTMTVGQVFRNNAIRISEDNLRLREGNTMLV